MATSVPTIGGENILHPGPAWEQALDLNTPGDFYLRANSYTCPLGARPGSAWLLMLRKDLDRLDKNAFHKLQWNQVTDAGVLQQLSIPSLAIVRSITMNLARPGDLKASQLVELQDKRRQLKMSSIDSQYNVRIPAPSATTGNGLYYTDSLNGGTIWTWQTLVTNIWADLPSTAGSAPTLPYTPDGTPEGFRFIGVSAWDALHVVLRKIDCTTSYDPIADTFSYVRLGITQTGLTDSVRGLAKRLMYDYDPGEDYQLANMPATVRVFFHRREEAHGWERDTPDGTNWEMTPVVAKDRATNITGAISGSVRVVWDDLPALYDDTGANSNSAALQTRANEIGDNIRNRIDISEERSRRMFQGLVTDILPGSEISKVRWRDFGDEQGLVTEIFNRPPLDDDVLLEREEHGGRSSFVDEKLQTPDLSRGTHPLWPRLSQPVQVDDGSSAVGATLTANVDGLFDGFVRRWAGGAWTSLDACWIRPSDLEGGSSPSEATVVKLRQKDTMVGRLSGIETSGGTTQPVYVVRLGGNPTGDSLPIGAIIMGYLAPIESGSTDKFYIDRDGSADTNWALMDGKSNLTPGSGIEMWDRKDASSDTFFVRARGATTKAVNTAFGRTVATNPDDDEVCLDDHPDHIHKVNPDTCHGDVSGTSHWDFLTSGHVTLIQIAQDESALALEHTFNNGQGAGDNCIEMTPPNKKLHFFERVA